jgi:DNA polymerase-1
MSGQRLFLIDGSAQIFRAFHAVRGLTNARGLPTNAAFGYTQMLLKVVRDHQPDYAAVVFDRPEPTFRHALYPAYKANRPPVPAELVPQFEWIKRITAALGVPQVEVPGQEADDLIATIARRAEAAGIETVIVTGDKDFCQVVSDRVTLLDTMKDKATGPAEVRERYGVGPERVVDVMALMGDAVDNVPGVPGVGEKTAVKLIAEHGSLEGVFAAADSIKGKLGEKIRAHRDDALLSRKLVTIVTDVLVDAEPTALVVAEPDRAALDAIFAELDFTALRKAFAPQGTTSAACDYRTVATDADLAALVAGLRAAGRFAVDTETTSPEPTRATLVGLSFSWEEGVGFYVPVAHEGEDVPQLPKDCVLAALKPVLEDPTLGKIGQNIKYDAIVLAREGIELGGIVADTMLASYVLDPSRTQHNMDALARDFLGRKTLTYSEVTGTGKAQVPFARVPVSTATRYAAEDAEVTWCLAAKLLPEIEARGLGPLYDDIEVPLVPVLADMERAGVAIDEDLFARLAVEAEADLARLTAEVHSQAGTEFNLNSPKQLGEVLFGRMGIKPLKRTKTGPSTDVEVLEKLAGDYPICRLLVEHRQAQKLKGTYIDALPRLVNPETGRIHTSFNQTVAATGRLSSSDPNLQNIPIRTEAGRRIRAGFVAAPGKVLVGADYSQIELRILAHVSGDADLVDSFKKGEDIHERTARQMFGLLPGMVTPDLRRQAKTINFGIVYGMSAYGLARQLGISNGEADRLIENYFARYGGVRAFLDATIERARSEKRVTTLFGRVRPVPEIDSPDRNVRGFAERVAINTPIQGTAADLIKRAMIAIHRRLPAEGLRRAMILQVHDELLFEVPEDAIDRATRLVREEMEAAGDLAVPLVVDVASGRSWADVH